MACATGRETTPPSPVFHWLQFKHTFITAFAHLLVSDRHKCICNTCSPAVCAPAHASTHTHRRSRHSRHPHRTLSRNHPQVDVVSFHSYNGNQTDLALQIAKLRKVAEAAGKPLGFASEIMNRPVDPAVHVYIHRPIVLSIDLEGLFRPGTTGGREPR